MLLAVLSLVIPISKAGAQATMTYESCTVIQDSFNAFQSQYHAKVLKINIQTKNSADPLRVNRFYFTNQSTSLSNIKAIKLIYTGGNDISGQPFGSNFDTVDHVLIPVSNQLTFAFNDELTEGSNYFFLLYDIGAKANIGDHIDASLDSFELENSIITVTGGNPAGKRFIERYCKYCPLTVQIPNTIDHRQLGMTNVKFEGAFTNSTSDQDNLIFYPSKVAKVYSQNSYELTISHGKGYAEQIGGWIDWNNDGYFGTDEEVFYTEASNPAEDLDVVVNVPCHATAGIHKMRIISDDTTSSRLSPCADPEYGDAEEYLIEVLKDTFSVSFKADDLYMDNPGQLKNTSGVRSGGAQYEWDLNDDGIFEYKGFDAEASYSSTGTKKVGLRLTLNGCDTSFTKTVYGNVNVKSPASPPESDFIADRNISDTSTTVRLFDVSTAHPGYWQWQISPESIFGAPAYIFVNDTDTTSQNPEIQFLYEGKYTVSLQTSNATGKGTLVTKADYIVIGGSGRICQNDTLTSMSGILYDDGGPGMPYSPSKSCQLLIKPPCAKEIKLTFKSFDVSSHKKSSAGVTADDYLRIYDGEDSTGTALHVNAGYNTGIQNIYPGNSPTLPTSISTSSGAMFIEWDSDNSFLGDGFEAYWESVPKDSLKPVSIISGPDTVFLKQPIKFTALSQGTDLNYYWDINSDGLIENTSSSVIHAFQSTGHHTVTFITGNCAGLDTARLDVYVRTPQTIPQVDFVSSHQQVSTGDHVQFTDLSTNDPYSWNWIITHINPNAGYRYINSTEFSKNPIIQFNETGIYTIELQATNAKGTGWERKTHYITVYEHCEPYVHNVTADASISEVIITDDLGNEILRNSSGTGINGYEHFASATIPTLYSGGTYHYRIKRNTDFNDITGKFYIDYNRNGDFNQIGELIHTEPRITGTEWMGSFTIPGFINKGVTRLRIGVNYVGQVMYPCDNNLYGEYEDYTVAIYSDTVRPVIELIGNDTVIIEEYYNYVDSGFTAYDNVAGNLSGQVIITSSPSLDTKKAGTYILNFSVFDNTNPKNQSIDKQRVVIVLPDTTKPRIILKGNEKIAHEVNHQYVDQGAIFSDNSGQLSFTDTNSTVIDNILGDYSVVYTAKDARGNTRTKIREVSVIDTTPPEIKMTEPYLEVQVGTVFNDPWVNTPDNYWYPSNIKVNSTYDPYYPKTDSIRTYYITYTAIDGSGNSSSAVRTVQIIDSIRPKIFLQTDTIQWALYKEYQDPDVTGLLTDNYYNPEELTLKRRNDFNVNVSVIGLYHLKYYAQDPSGNTSMDTIDYFVEVVDRVEPSIKLRGPNIMQVERWHDFEDPWVIKMDNYDENLKVITGGTFKNTLLPGEFIRSYVAEDQSGNRSDTVYRMIVVRNPLSIQDEEPTNETAPKYYPNPAMHTLNIEFNKALAGQLYVGIYNNQGKLLEDLYAGSMKERLSLDLSPYSAGSYFIRYQTSTSTGYIPVIIAR